MTNTTEHLNPSNVYRLQREASEKAQNAQFLAEQLSRSTFDAIRNGALIGSDDWQRDPQYRAAQAAADTLAEAVSAAQDALGGVVYRIPTENLALADKKLTALHKRAAKIGQSVEWFIDGDYEVVKHRDGTVSRFAYIVLKADAIKIAGWIFLAKLTIEEGGVLVSKVPGSARAWDLYREGAANAQAPAHWNRQDEPTQAAQAALDAINLGAYCDETTARDCDHCQLDRRRKVTYLVEEIATGNIRQVGSSCLADFLGTDPHARLRYAEYLTDWAEDAEGDWGGGAGGTRRELGTEYYLANVCTMLRLYGWAPRSGSDHPTADQATSNAWAKISNSRDRKTGAQLWEDITDADEARAETVLAWALEHFPTIDNPGDFDRNCLVAARGSTATDRTRGILAYLPVAHARWQEKEIEFARQREKAVESVHVGQVGDRIVLTLTVLKVFEHEGNYGTTFITQLEDEAGNRFKWFGSYELERGLTYTGKWTVKGHDEFKGVKETALNRPKVELVNTEQVTLEVTA